MEAGFWHEVWEKHQIGFHQAEINTLLTEHWPGLRLAGDCTVLVPLCGKSKDMIWLAQLGHHVLGVELSEVAVVEFFEELGVVPQISEKGPFKCFSANNVEIWVGDFFALTAEDLSQVGAVYDRAALVALPPEMRLKYVELLGTLLPDQMKTLLVTIEYSNSERQGPPFSISAELVRELFSEGCEIKVLGSEDFSILEEGAVENAFSLNYQ